MKMSGPLLSALLCAALLPAPASASSEKLIPFTISATLWQPELNKSVPTPPALIAKIQQVFALWGSVPGTGLKFRYDGLEARRYDNPATVPSDGRLHLMFDTRFQMGKFTAGAGGYDGNLPRYDKGFVFFNTRAGLHALRFDTLIHEVGHALGLGHGASIDSQMYCGSQLWNGHEFLAFSEQDRAALRQAWNPAGVMSISGQVRAKSAQSGLLVHAVNVRNGRTYATLSEPDGSFAIPVLTAGDYRVFAKTDESGVYDSRVDTLPSWYQGPGRSTNEPYAGAVFTLTHSQPKIAALDLPLIQKPVPFNFWWSGLLPRQGQDFVPAFLRPGHTVDFALLHNGGTISALEPYGSHPDYTLSSPSFDRLGPAYRLRVSAAPAAEPGHRLVLARGRDGGIQAGLVGIHIIGDRLPDQLTANVSLQLKGPIGPMKADYWKD